MQVFDLRLARVRVNARHHRICVVGELEDSITPVYLVQVSRRDYVQYDVGPSADP